MSQHGHSDAHKQNVHGSLKSYTVGFALSLILTVLSFGCVMSGAVPQELVVPGIVAFCVVQLLVQLVFFLHMGTAPEQRDNLSIGVFSLLIIAIVVAGSVWVMHNMNTHMLHPVMQSMSSSIG
jgi:cytochrome o ubiquinol oxidase operon protein cyoD